MEELLAWIARGLVDEPDAVRVERFDEGDVEVKDDRSVALLLLHANGIGLVHESARDPLEQLCHHPTQDRTLRARLPVAHNP